VLAFTILSANSAISFRYVLPPAYSPVTRIRASNSVTIVSGLLKQGITDYFIMIVINLTKSSIFLRTSSNPAVIRLLKYSKRSLSTPSIRSMYSWVSLNGAPSKFILPGLLYNMKPKSIWIKWPFLSIIMFPLWRSLIANKYEKMLYAARLLMKFVYASSNLEPKYHM